MLSFHIVMEKTKILNGKINNYSLHVDKPAVKGEQLGLDS